jgi:pseudouridine kinase
VSDLVACIGGCHIDSTALVDGDVVLGTSNPASVTRQPGGVATNVARTLAALGVDVVLAGMVGADAAGDALVAGLVAEGIRVDGLARVDGPTAEYTAVVDGGGDLVVGIAAMEIYERLDEAWSDAVLPVLAEADVWVLDTNPSPAALARLTAARPRLLLGDPVSVAKASRLVPLLERFDVVFPDRAELAVLAGAEGTVDDLVGRVSSRCGVVATLGEDGVVVATRSVQGHFAAVAPTAVVDPTGAGDALLGGWVAGTVQGSDPLRLGLAAASVVVEQRGAVPSDLHDRVRRRL